MIQICIIFSVYLYFVEFTYGGECISEKLSKKPKTRGFGWSFNGMRKVGV